MSSALRAVRHEDILLITLENPSGLPRLERAVLRALATQMELLSASSDFVGAVITGGELAFCAGAELGEITSLFASETLEFAREGQRVMRWIQRSRKPLIAAVRGYCLGGGFDLALACHARIAAADAIFAHRGASLGLVTGWGGTQRLPRLIGRSRALEILATGRSIAADEALELGLVRVVVPANEILPRAIQLARACAAIATTTSA